MLMKKDGSSATVDPLHSSAVYGERCVVIPAGLPVAHHHFLFFFFVLSTLTARLWGGVSDVLKMSAKTSFNCSAQSFKTRPGLLSGPAGWRVGGASVPGWCCLSSGCFGISSGGGLVVGDVLQTTWVCHT